MYTELMIIISPESSSTKRSSRRLRTPRTATAADPLRARARPRPLTKPSPSKAPVSPTS